jgi:2-succinyl-5-enolpyruvyl-6-hydroxy-3-cyclohexene-1-carboxylate synthase
MDLDCRTLNTLWGSVLVETLAGLGLRYAIICPGSRSAPLAVAFSQSETIEAIPVLDERSGAFFALGLAKRLQEPVALVCTSGTAGANTYGAVIEAAHTGVPLLLLTADRPPELRECHAGQTIDQLKLFGHFPRWQLELALPDEGWNDGDFSPLTSHLAYLRQTLIQAWERSLYPVAGPVHLNCPFRDPLSPHPDPRITPLAESPVLHRFATDSQRVLDRWRLAQSRPVQDLPQPTLNFSPQETLLILVGPLQPSQPDRFIEIIAHLAQTFHCPVLTDALNPLRNAEILRPYAITTYDFILRNGERAETLRPQVILQIGELPTSKTLRQWLHQTQVLRYVITDGHPDNVDPLHGPVIHLRGSFDRLGRLKTGERGEPTPERQQYLHTWQTFDRQYRTQFHDLFSTLTDLREPKVAWLLSQTLPPDTLLFVANSTPIRDVEWFWLPSSLRPLSPFFSRGANGLDGTLSTALGMVHGSDRPGVLLTGDLSLLHDTNGFLQRSSFRGSLTIVLINNQGGGIFELLPIADFDPPFETFFATPQNIDFADLCQTYRISHTLIQTWDHLQTHLEHLPSHGIQVLEIRTDRRGDAVWRKQIFKKATNFP